MTLNMLHHGQEPTICRKLKWEMQIFDGWSLTSSVSRSVVHQRQSGIKTRGLHWRSLLEVILTLAFISKVERELC